MTQHTYHEEENYKSKKIPLGHRWSQLRQQNESDDCICKLCLLSCSLLDLHNNHLLKTRLDWKKEFMFLNNNSEFRTSFRVLTPFELAFNDLKLWVCDYCYLHIFFPVTDNLKVRIHLWLSKTFVIVTENVFWNLGLLTLRITVQLILFNFLLKFGPK